jgi:thiol-disulfide isomerase/thioredoxin
MEPPSRGRHPSRTIAVATAALAACLAVAACGSGGGGKSPAPDYAKALRGAPAPLAALYRQGNDLLDGGLDALRLRLADLHGHPVVVNVWAEWCGPCREEFAYYQQLSAKEGNHVAFLGVDTADNRDAATTFLADHPVPYPSYVEQDLDAAKQFFNVLGLPATVFYDSSGEVVHMNQGGYASQADLAADIRQYAN